MVGPIKVGNHEVYKFVTVVVWRVELHRKRYLAKRDGALAQ
jgi:hypothetical protein